MARLAGVDLPREKRIEIGREYFNPQMFATLI